MIFDYFVAYCYFLVCVGISLAFFLFVFKNTDNNSIWRDVMFLFTKVKEGEGGLPVLVLWPTFLFIIFLPLVCNFYTNQDIPTEVFVSREGFMEHVKENWGKVLFLWFLSAGSALAIVENIVKTQKNK